MAPVPAPLSKRTVIEAYHEASDDVTRLAIAFAGRIAANLGAKVISIHADGRDPLQKWGPPLPNGSSALATFLGHGKVSSHSIPSGYADLLTNDAALGSQWSQGAAVVLKAPAHGRSGPCELTVLAASGLLDIFGDPGRQPLPLPGNQVAYSAGTAAFNALVASIFADVTSGEKPRSEVPIIDVAKWLNWKHFLAAYFGRLNAGIGRAEDWIAARCADGYVAVVFQDKDMQAMAELTGSDVLSNPGFSTLQGRRKNIAAFNAIIADWAKSRKRNDIIDQSRIKRLPFGPVLTISELFHDRQMLSRSFLDTNPKSSSFGMPRLPAIWSHIG